MSYRKYRIGIQLLGLENCPHCGVASPLLSRKWMSETPIFRSDGRKTSVWAVFSCSACGHLVTAKGSAGDSNLNPYVVSIFPDVWEIAEVVPARVRNYLVQAHKTLSAPDASVVMSASSIDAMLKDHGLDKDSLYVRISEAVTKGILTENMAEWAHRVRLDANNPRHADTTTPHMSPIDAKRAFDFANALAEYLYLLPSRMPPEKPKAE